MPHPCTQCRNGSARFLDPKKKFFFFVKLQPADTPNCLCYDCAQEKLSELITELEYFRKQMEEEQMNL